MAKKGEQHRAKRVTRVEVARRAGVSKTTVTNVLAGASDIPIHPDTRERVLTAARDLGYQPNFAARSLVQRNTNIIGLLLPSQEAQFGIYYARMIAGLLSASETTPYNFLYLSQEHPGKYQRCLAQGYLDAAVVLQTRADDAAAEVVARSGLPAVTMNYLNESGLPQVSTDYEGIIDLTYTRLAEGGARLIVLMCLVGDKQPNMRHVRHHLVMARKLGDGVECRHVESIAEAVKLVEAKGKGSALVVDGLPYGIEAHRLMKARKLPVGDGLPLVVLNAGEPMAEIPPGMTLYDAEPEKVGSTAWKVLDRLLRGEKVPHTTLVPFVLRDPNRASSN